MINDSQFRCTICGTVGTVGRCCGRDTRVPLNEAAYAEIIAEEQCKANAEKEGDHGNV